MNHTPPPLTATQRKQLVEDGYLVVPDLIDLVTLDALRDEFNQIVDATAQQLHAEGLIPASFSEAGFDRQLAEIAGFSVDAARELVNRIHGVVGGEGGHMGPGVFDLLTHPRLLDAIESLVGPEIIGSSVYRIRPKAPGLERGAVPWHQDSGYLLNHCDKELIITCWIPLVDANLENGCLHVIPKVHQNGILRHHTGGKADYLVINDEDLPAGIEPIAVPVPKGGVLMMTNMTPHASFANTSDHVRWSVDLRYQSAGVPNNVGQMPEQIDLDGPAVELACYPPEADFVLRSEAHPEKVMRDWKQLKKLRDNYNVRAQQMHVAERWTPVETTTR